MSEKGSRDEIETGLTGSENAPAIARLCYVDDSRTSAYVVRRMLQPFGYQVDHFSSAEPAFVALVQEDYDLLLTDLKVSSTGMDGDDLIRTLRQSGHPKISTMPIIVITGASDAEVLVGVYDAGANQVMKKPVDADELDGHIRRLLFSGQHNGVRGASTVTETTPRKVERRSGDATVVTLHTTHRKHRDVAHEFSRHTDSASAVVPENLADANDTPVPKPAAPSSVTRRDDNPHQAFNAQPSAPAADATQQTASSTAVGSTEFSDAPPTSSVSSAAEPVTSFGNEQHSRAAFQDDSVVEDSEEVVIIEPEMRAGNRRQDHGQAADKNILHDIEQYPLIINERVGLLESSRLLNMAQSIVELVGFRGLMMRILGVGLALTLLLVGWNFYFNQGVPVETTKVQSGEIFQSITVPGRVVSKQRVNVSSARAGRLVEILVKEGDKVKRGQVLAKIDDRELLSRLNRAKASLSDARAGIDLAERTLKRLKKANSKGAVARRFVEDAEVDLRSARTRAGIAVEEVRSATLDFDNQKVKAAFDGTVTARYAEIGQWVGPTETLFTLVDESQREIEVRVDAADSVAVDVGQVVAVSSDAFPGLEWQESVVRMGTATDNNKNANAVKVYISLGNDAPSLRFGQQVDADIRTAWNPNTLKIPFEALISRDGKTMVAVLENGHVRMKIVETGIEDFSMAEIKQGLNEGETVILAKGMVLHNGERAHSKQVDE